MTSERERRESIMEDALRGIAWTLGGRPTLIAQAQAALKRVEESRRIEAEAQRLCEEGSQ